MLRLVFVLVLTGAVIWALIECIQADDAEIRHLPKIWWILIILFFWAFGAVAWFVAGRPQRPGRRPAPGPGGPTSGFPGGQRPRRLGPEDDPDFLRELDRSNKDHERMLERWEEDLRRRERDLRKHGEEPPEDGQRPTDPPSR